MSEEIILEQKDKPSHRGNHKTAKRVPRPASIIHPYDIIDTIFPLSSQAEERRTKHIEGKGRRPTPMNHELTEYFSLTKGFISAIQKSIEGLGDVSSRLSSLEAIAENKGYINSTSSAPIRLSDLPQEAYGYSSADWLRCALLLYTGTKLSSEQAMVVLQEASLIRSQGFGMSQGGRCEMLREVYIIGGNNFGLAESTLDKENSFLSDAKRRWFDEDADPFAGFAFSVSPKTLDIIPRGACPSCGKLSHLYCAECLKMAPPDLEGENFTAEDSAVIATAMNSFLFSGTSLPLPLTIDIVHHPQEKITKSTGLQACLTSPNQARLVKFPEELPDYSPEDTIVLFPTADAVEISDPSLDFSKIKRAVIVEATWQKANSVVQHPKIIGLPKIKLTQRVSTFWRHQELGNQFLSTLEAIYYLCLETHERQLKDNIPSPVGGSALSGGLQVHPTYASLGQVDPSRQISPENQYKGQFDDMLVLYANRQQRVHQKYKNAPQAKVPRVWRSKAVAADMSLIEEHIQEGKEHINE